MFLKKLIFAILLLFVTLIPSQQKPPMWDEIQKFKELDQTNAPPKNAILLIGSSSFTNWKDVNEYFPDKIIINRGFGGSSIKDLNFYAEDLLRPYQPKQIIIYCGENDFAADEKLSSKEVFKRYKTFYKTIRNYFPDIEVDYISIKLSPSRKHLWTKFEETNALIKKFQLRKKNAEYIDVVKPMQDKNGMVNESIFLEDQLHMKPSGYKIWQKAMQPFMK